MCLLEFLVPEEVVVYEVTCPPESLRVRSRSGVLPWTREHPGSYPSTTETIFLGHPTVTADDRDGVGTVTGGGTRCREGVRERPETHRLSREGTVHRQGDEDSKTLILTCPRPRDEVRPNAVRLVRPVTPTRPTLPRDPHPHSVVGARPLCDPSSGGPRVGGLFFGSPAAVNPDRDVGVEVGPLGFRRD